MDEPLTPKTITIRKVPADGFDRYYILLHPIAGLDEPVLSCVRYTSDDVFEALSTLTLRHGPCCIVWEVKR